MNIFISGRPGCGKSTLIAELIKELQKKGKKIAGIITPEVRKQGEREAFLIKDIASNKQEILASVNIKSRCRVSKYGVNIEGIDKIVNKFLENFDSAGYIFIDELGKMEMFSKKFKIMLEKILNSKKIMIVTLHRAFIKQYKDKGKFFWLEKNKAEKVKADILKEIKER